ncbi:hypothetical protein ABS71_21800 [bacterium SCN 62-11]|nr:DUF58 domain-containing protein [Candidatus Eremiobacteraeota bacterium]ODT56509.1 MAG: hypothetical protein ABS71_21800 [bacterium SCN 62-11]
MTKRLLKWSWTALGWFPLSPLGLVCFGASIPVMRYLALGSQDLVLQSLCSGFLVVLALVVVLVCLRTLTLLRQLRQGGGALPHGAEAERPYWLPSPVPLWSWFPFVQVSWRWLEPGAEVRIVRRDGFDQEEIVMARRGHYGSVVREFQVSDLLGLSRIRFQRIQRGDFRVIPGVGQLHQQPLLVRWSSGEDVSDPRGNPDGDRVDLRQYSRGDSPRTILWKVFARTRRLMVRVPERALAPRPKVCAYLMTGPRDEAAAAVCRVLLEGDMLGPEWRFGSDGTSGHDHHKVAAMERLCRSADSRVPQPSQVSAYLRQAEQDGYSQGIVVLPLDLAGQDVAVRDALRASRVPLQLCLAIDGQPAPVAEAGWKKWLVRPQAAQQLGEHLRQAAALWRGFPGQVVLIDRRNGAILGDLQVFARRSA